MKIVPFFLFFFTIQIATAQDIFDVARKGSVAEMKQLITSNPGLINTYNADGNSPLLLAVYRGNTDVAKFLIENGAVIDDKSSAGSPLIAATFKESMELVELLLKKGANINALDSQKNPALYYALQSNNTALIKKLLEFKPNLELQLEDKRTIKEFAKSINNQEINNLINTKP
jgi:uncharacterized protein